MDGFCKKNGCYMFAEGTDERAACEQKCRIQKDLDNIDRRRHAKSVGFVPLKGTLTGRLRSDPNHQYGVPWQDRIASGDNIKMADKDREFLDLTLDYKELELRTLAALGVPKNLLEGSTEYSTFAAFRKAYQQEPPPIDNPCPKCGAQLWRDEFRSHPHAYRCPNECCTWRSKR